MSDQSQGQYPSHRRDDLPPAKMHPGYGASGSFTQSSSSQRIEPAPQPSLSSVVTCINDHVVRLGNELSTLDELLCRLGGSSGLVGSVIEKGSATKETSSSNILDQLFSIESRLGTSLSYLNNHNRRLAGYLGISS